MSNQPILFALNRIRNLHKPVRQWHLKLELL